ncbi:MAG: hypothetical protein ACRD88_20775 [Terriglobia bacterium]
MARKKRKKERPERNTETAGWSGPSFGEAEEPQEREVEESEAPAEASPPEATPAAGQPEAEAALPWERAVEPMEPPLQPAPPSGGILARIARWFQGSEPPAPGAGVKNVPFPAPIESFPHQPASSHPAASMPGDDSIRRRADLAAPASHQHSEAMPPSKVDHILAVLTLERVMPELDAARRELLDVKVTSNERIRQLEAERDRFRAEAEKLRAENPDPASRAAALQEAEQHSKEFTRQLEAERDRFRAEAEHLLAENAEAGARATALRQSFQEQQQRLQDAQQESEARIRQLEGERDQRQTAMEAGRTEGRDLNLRIRQLEAMLEIQQTGGRSDEDWKRLESRLQTLEQDLEAARRRVRPEKEEAKARVQQIERERDQMASSLAAKEKEFAAASRRLEGAMDRLKEIEAELAQWKARAASEPRKEAPPSSAAASGMDASHLMDFHQQTMSRLTVVLGYADLLAMNPRADASAQETAREIRKEGQLLSEIIKKFTLPPDSRPGE